MVIQSYIVEYGTIVYFTTTITYRTAKQTDGTIYELVHLGELSRSTEYTVCNNIFNTIEEVLEFIKTTDIYKARKKYELQEEKEN